MIDKELISIFDVLDLEPNCTRNQIKKAYKKKAKFFHPDRFQDAQDKKEAEKEFKVIKKAYDYLMSLDDSYFLEDDLLDDTKELEILMDNNFSENQLKSKNNKNKSFEQQQKEAIKYMEKEIANSRINMLYAYQCIKKNKMIFAWNIAFKDSDKLNECLIKEALYRRSVKESDKYKGFIKNYHFYNNIDLHANLTIGSNYPDKQFNHFLYYEIKSICPDCNGVGCNNCQDGIIKITKKQKINFQIKPGKKFYEIEGGGHDSPLGSGKLIISVNKVNKPIVNQFNFKTKSSISASIVNPILDGVDWTKTQLESLINLMVKHKLTTCLISIIVILIIIIICLAVLL